LVRAYSEAPALASPAALVSASLLLAPVPTSLWIEGPTFAVFVPRTDLDALLARLDRMGLDLQMLGQRMASPGSPMAILGHAWQAYSEMTSAGIRDPLGQVFVNRGPVDSQDRVVAGDLVLLVLTMAD
jgi:hypothetical protein